ncbi:MAG: hypothetical protein E3J47_08145 [Candidatus Stahlbacteria bacterium]|nr:MAG: hypothetical protein E3J47_08145 [Candidatus Stahlbacteria bacterium]
MLLLDDVIKNLKEIRAKHGNIEICKIGHFGEINEMDDWGISVRKVNVKGEKKRKPVVDICTPDIGPEPI